jgi:HrpA-like RNA helicase
MPNILVFLPSIPEIKKVGEKISSSQSEFSAIRDKLEFIVQEFHGAMTPAEKNVVLNPDDTLNSMVRIILSTNIAETAVTIDHIMYVLDSGLEREFYVDEVTSLSTMKEERISKSSSLQRQGRAGRVCNGFCYKMYNEKDFHQFIVNKKPEIIRMDISDVLLLTVELNEFFKISDLMFYNDIIEKALSVTQTLDERGCFKTEKDKKVLSHKGKFIMDSSLNPSVAAFLYENLRLDNEQLGLIATISLEKPSGYFRQPVLIL